MAYCDQTKRKLKAILPSEGNYFCHNCGHSGGVANLPFMWVQRE